MCQLLTEPLPALTLAVVADHGCTRLVGAHDATVAWAAAFLLAARVGAARRLRPRKVARWKLEAMAIGKSKWRTTPSRCIVRSNASTTAGVLLTVFTWVCTALGWLRATLTVAGVTGIIQGEQST